MADMFFLRAFYSYYDVNISGLINLLRERDADLWKRAVWRTAGVGHQVLLLCIDMDRLQLSRARATGT